MVEKSADIGDSGANRFIELLRASGLMSAPSLSRSIREFGTTYLDQSCPSLDNFVMFLVRRNEITAWQADKLREGRFKGFLIDHYVLMEHLRNEPVGPTQWYGTYLARDTNTNRRVLLRFLRTAREPAASARYEVIDATIEGEQEERKS